MKKIILLLTVILFISCSSDDSNEDFNPTLEDLIGTYNLQSYTYEDVQMDVDECDLKQKVEFSSDEIKITGAYWNDSFLNEDCHVYSNTYRFLLEGTYINIENNGSFSYSGRFIDNNTIRIRTYYDGMTGQYIYKKSN